MEDMKKSRFQFLQKDFQDLFTLCKEAEQATDKNIALLKSRMALENIVKSLGAKKRNLFDKINELKNYGVLDGELSS